MAKLSPTARSIFAIVDGILLFFAIEGVFYAIAFLGLHRSFDTPTIPYLGFNLVWALLAALAGGYTAGRVAHRSPVTHGIVIACLFLLLSLYNLNKGVGGRHTGFVVAFNFLVPLAFIWGAWFVSQRPMRRTRS